MHPSQQAVDHPDRLAITCTDGTSLTSAALDDQSRRLANVLEQHGFRAGDTVAILIENTARYLAVALGAQRAGLLFVPVNWHLTADEVGYVVQDSGARGLVTSRALADLATEVVRRCPDLALSVMIDAVDGFDDLDAALAGATTQRPAREPNGHYMFYSSGTTGRPKGITPTLPATEFGSGLPVETFLADRYGFGPDTTYLSTGPLYHAAPLGWTLGTIALGGAGVVMARFDAEACLAAIETHRITHAQFVPTMFVRMLKLPAEVRARYDLSSLRVVVHAAAPCPVDVKRSMIDWLGPIVHEFYSGSEGNCFFAIDSPEWLSHVGSVGVPLLGTPHILDDDGHELPVGGIGQIWVDSPHRFAYHNDPGKTAGAFNDRGWSTLGDIGYLDHDGFLYLSDRRTDLILSGGVNVYPREVEAALTMHPAVTDVAVVGVAHDEMGQEVRAVVQAAPGFEPGPGLEAELIAYCARTLARFKRPRRVDFVDELPRLPSGKILRRVVREQYAGNQPGAQGVTRDSSP